MPLFKSSQNPQILFLFQFVQLFYSQYTYSRPISNSSYRFSFPKFQFSIFRSLSQILLLRNLTSKFLLLYLIYYFSSSLPQYQYYSYPVLGVLNLTYLVLRILYYRKLLSLTYSYISKLSYCSLLPVIVHYRSLSCPYLILRILGLSYPIIGVLSFSYLFLRILSLQPFTFIKW